MLYCKLESLINWDMKKDNSHWDILSSLSMGLKNKCAKRHILMMDQNQTVIICYKN
jgi:hypothetical protein